MFLKFVFLAAIILVSVLGIYLFIPPVALLPMYLTIAIIPVVFLILKKNLLNSLLVWFSLILFGEVANIPLHSLPDIDPQRMIWFFIFFILLIEIVFKQRRIIAGDNKVEIAMILFCVYVLMSMIITGEIYREGHGVFLSTFLSGYAIPFSIFFLGKNLVDNEQKIKRIFIFFTIIGFYLGLTGIFEHFPILQPLVFPGYIMNIEMGIHQGRSRGPFLNASTNGAVIGMIFFMTIYLLFQNYKKWAKRFFIISILVMLTTLGFTFTRTPWLAFLLSLCIFPIFFPRIRIVFIISLLVLIVTIGIYSYSGFKPKWQTEGEGAVRRETTLGGQLRERTININPIYSRINLYAAMWRMFLEKPIFGFGFYTFKKFSPPYFYKLEGIPYIGVGEGAGLHDTLGGILVELGLVGLGLFLFILFFILKNSINLYRRLSSESFSKKGLIAVFWGIFIIYMVNIQFIEMQYFMFANSLFFVTGGIIVGLNQTLYGIEKPMRT